MILVWLFWVASGPLMLLMAAVLIECAIFLRAERGRAGNLSGAVAIEACRRSARRAGWVLLASLAIQFGMAAAISGNAPTIVAFWVPWYYIVMGLLYPPLLFLPVALVVAATLLTRYLLRAPSRWREAGWRALTTAAPGS
jgi:hypothetical protein